MNRRDSIKKLALGSGLLVSLPSWALNWTAEDVASAGIFTNNEATIIAAIADTIIPAGKTIGALSVGVDKYLTKLLADCYDKSAQDNVARGLMAIEKQAKEKWSKSFSLCDQQQREKLLLAFAASPEKEDQDFFNLVKSETIRGFSTSKEVMLKYLHYKIALGHYYGCVDIKA